MSKRRKMSEIYKEMDEINKRTLSEEDLEELEKALNEDEYVCCFENDIHTQ